MQYMKVWTSFLDILQPLTDAEIGRLFVAMLAYAKDGAEPETFEGNERFIWPAARQQLDLLASRDDVYRQNGTHGGRPKTKQNQTEQNETKDNQSEPRRTYKIKENKIKENNKKETSKEKADEDLIGVREDHDRIFDAAEGAGFTRSESVRDRLVALYAEYGLEKVLAGIGSCVEHGAPNLAYLAACLRGGEQKKAKQAGRVIAAQNYEQRDYSDVVQMQEERQRRRIAEHMAAQGG